MKEIKAPGNLNCRGYSVFLAGSIDLGKAEKWQGQVVKMLDDQNIVVLNPRRDDWDSSWEQSIDNAKFREQVEWELNALDKADLIVMYFDPKTKAPISLLELGLYAKSSKKMMVCCPEGFWRKGNVDIVCKRFGLQTSSSLDELMEQIRKFFEE